MSPRRRPLRVTSLGRRTLAAGSMGLWLALSMWAPAAGACPRCVEGVLARQAVLQDDFGHNLAIALLPFLIIGAVSVRAEAIGRHRGREQPSSRVATRAQDQPFTAAGERNT